MSEGDFEGLVGDLVISYIFLGLRTFLFPTSRLVRTMDEQPGRSKTRDKNVSTE